MSMYDGANKTVIKGCNFFLTIKYYYEIGKLKIAR